MPRPVKVQPARGSHYSAAGDCWRIVAKQELSRAAEKDNPRVSK